MFDIEPIKALEIVGRVAIIYIACMVLLRVTGRREMSELSPMDLLTMLLVSETVSPALTGGEESITGGLVAASTLFALVVATSFIVFRHRKAEAVIQGRALILIDDGKVDREVMHDQRISDDDLNTTLHQHGLLEARDVGRAYIEPDGQITIIKREDFERTRDRRHGGTPAT